MKILAAIFILLLAKPVASKTDSKIIKYENYFNEMVEVLKLDNNFRRALRTASPLDFSSGQIAENLSLQYAQIRKMLNEIKRRELARLRDNASKVYQDSNQQYIDDDNEECFEIIDLVMLIKRTIDTMVESDRIREANNKKKYIILKNFIRKSNDIIDSKNAVRVRWHGRAKFPDRHALFEEMWKKQDILTNTEFSPLAFFIIHDVNNDDVWDDLEVKALFGIGLDKLTNREDMREGVEEMNQMRNEIFAEADTNDDGVIDQEEFMELIEHADDNDFGCQAIHKNPLYVPDEYAEFECRRD